MAQAMPTVANLIASITDMGQTAPSEEALTRCLNRALDEWKAATRRNPFLASTLSSGSYAPSAAPITIQVSSSKLFAVAGQAILDTYAAQETQTVTAIPDATHITLAALAQAHNGSATPFMVQPVTTRFFDPPGPRSPQSGVQSLCGGGRILELDPTLVSLVSVSISGVPFTLGQPGVVTGEGQFWMEPVNDPFADPPQPYNYINFWAPIWGLPQSVAVTGVFGWGIEVPDEVFDAVLRRAHVLCMPAIAGARSNGLAQSEEGQTMERFAVGKDAGAWAYETGLQMAYSDATVNRYKNYRMSR
jgi:hypothetical protein